LSWSFDPAAEHYELKITNLANGAQINQNDLQVNTFTPASELAIGQYRAQVRSVGFDGTRGAWSAPLNFTVNASSQPPVAPTLSAPSGKVTDTTPTFRWNAVSGAARYGLEVKNLATNERPIRQTSLQTTQYTPTTPLPPGKYRAWVRTYDALGRESGWSTPLDFEITASGARRTSAAAAAPSATLATSSGGTDELTRQIDLVMAAWPDAGEDDDLTLGTLGRRKRSR
jgi:hypothetical protein